MPTYIVRSTFTNLDAATKQRIAQAITTAHAEITGANTYFAQVVFDHAPREDWFIGGAPLQGDTLFIHGHVRSGRTDDQKRTLVERLVRDIAVASGVLTQSIWVYLSEIRPSLMAEFGHVLPEPGEEAAWFDALPEEDRRLLAAIAERAATSTASVPSPPAESR
ncbi:phenylpyruvate tautomerase PptA (4-oxalocrotonate tautomerase family) [Luteibacter sp. OK325]|uniref:tautomerase family protein n=1 Tax=Luteibacter sp. OK325 TaxID=2135670 RepID=UPI000D33ECA3|nr:tautomerase family protein [Luteibacter sp. OK325]PTR30920.1 phenylpyruvate tautomerase PptA (4-oxalocrotonate tautomerase family) [Luteibacter sp. OK325]